MARQVIGGPGGKAPFLLPISSLTSHGRVENVSQSSGERLRSRDPEERRPDIQENISGLKRSFDEQRGWLREIVSKEFMDMKQFIRQELEDSKQSQRELHNSIKLELQSLKPSPFQTSNPKDASYGTGTDSIQRELQRLKVSLSSEVQASKVEMQRSFSQVLSKQDGAPSSAIQTGVHASDPGDPTASTSSGHAAVRGNRDDGYAVLNQDVEMWDPTSTYKKVMDAIVKNRSLWHNALDRIGLLKCVCEKEPRNCGTAIIGNPTFNVFQSLLIMVNTVIMAYETETEVTAQLQDPVGEIPKWLSESSTVFNLIFAVELVFRLLSQRSWFFVDPSEWGWNLFDFILVIVCLGFEFYSDTRLSFIRTVRIIRVFRVARIIRVMRFFRQLRQMLYSILACLASLAWAFLFLAATMAMFSLVCMQGVVEALEQERENGAPIILSGGISLKEFIDTWYSTFTKSVFALIVAVTGGADWATLLEPMAIAGPVFSISFCLYVLFVIVGVMNVLTGVFLNSASEFVDADLIVQNEQVRIESLCEQMIGLFMALDQKAMGKVDWSTFQAALSHAEMQAYMGSMGIEPTHIRLIFELLDRDGSGEIEMEEFVMGLVRLKGTAKAIDARIIQREIGLLPLKFQAMGARRLVS